MNTKDISIEQSRPMAMNALKFALWLFIVSVVMIFASLTSAYIVRRGEGNWLEFQLPVLFYVNSAVILLSSITMQTAYFFAKKDEFFKLRLWSGITLILGIVFLMLQWSAWEQLVSQKVFFVGNPSGSFVYVLSGLHAAHIVAGLILIIAVLILSLRDHIHSKSMLWMEICTTFWHFLDGLWLYLFFFLILNR